MADADDSYDFLELPKFFQKTRIWFDSMCDYRGGRIIKGAIHGLMFLLNPFHLFSKNWFGPINMFTAEWEPSRKFLRFTQNELYRMEVATKWSSRLLIQGKDSQVPLLCTRMEGFSIPPLRTIRDGWKTLQFFNLCSFQVIFFWCNYVFVHVSRSTGILWRNLRDSNFGCSYHVGFVTLRNQQMSGNFNAFIVHGFVSKAWN